jgi:hypothetical protein
MRHRRGALTVDRRGGLLDLLLDLHLLLLGRGPSAAASAAATTTTSAGHGRDYHLRDALGGEEVGEYDGEVRRDLGVARGLEERVDLIGGDVGLFVCVRVCVLFFFGLTKTITMSEERIYHEEERTRDEREEGDEFQRSRTRRTAEDIHRPSSF